jgi:hypothetical protein
LVGKIDIGDCDFSGKLPIGAEIVGERIEFGRNKSIPNYVYYFNTRFSDTYLVLSNTLVQINENIKKLISSFIIHVE